MKVGTLFFSPSRSDLVVQSFRFDGFLQNREILNLSMVAGPVLLKIKGKSWIFIILGFKKLRKKTKRKFKNYEICQLLVSGALDDTKKMRTASADIFEKSGLEKKQINWKNI